MDIYQLYKLVFNNCYLSRLIYSFIQGSYINRYSKRKNGVSYNNISFRYLVDSYYFGNNKEYFFILLNDKLKSGSQFKNVVLYDCSSSGSNLSKFIYIVHNNNNQQHYEIETKEIFQKFYILHKNQLLYDSYRYSELLKILIDSRCLILLKMAYQDYIDLLNDTSNDKESNESNDNKLNQFLTNVNFRDNKERIYELVLVNGNIEIIKFFFEVVYSENDLLNSDQFKQKAIYWSIQSSNRDQVVDYLLNKLNYKSPNYYNGILDGYFRKFILLDYQLFKEIYESGTPMFYSKFDLFGNDISLLSNIINIDETIISNYTNTCDTHYYFDHLNSFRDTEVPFKKFIDFVNVSIFISLKLDPLNHHHDLQSLLDRINELIGNNETNENDNQEDLNQFNKHCDDNNTIDEICTNNNNNGIVEGIKNSILSLVSSNFNKFKLNWFGNDNSNRNINEESKPIIFNPFLNEPTKTNYDGFTNSITTSSIYHLEREIRRIYIFDFLLAIKNRPTDTNTTIEFLLKFAYKYNEYQLILDFNSFDYSTYFSTKETKETLIVKSSLYIAFKTANTDIIEFVNNHFSISKVIEYLTSKKYYRNEYSMYGKIFNCKSVSIDQQIKFISTILKLNLNYPFSQLEIIQYIKNNNHPNNILIETLENKIKNQ